MAQVTDAVKCSEGGVHEWTYLGKLRQEYRCNKCGDTITKDRLKKETDNA